MNRSVQRFGAVGVMSLLLAAGSISACGHRSYNTACAVSAPAGVQYVAASSSGSSSGRSGGSSSSGRSGGSSAKTGTTSKNSGSSTVKSGSSSGKNSGSSSSKPKTTILPGGAKAKVDSSGRVTASTSRHSAAVYGSQSANGGYRPSSGYHVRNGVAYPFSGGVLLPAGRPYPYYSGSLWGFPGFSGLYPIGVYPPGYLGYSC